MEQRSMSEIHAQARQWYKENGIDSLTDEQALQLLVCLFTNKGDYKKACKNLFEKFQSLENILNADAKILATVDGVTETLAVYLSLIKVVKVKSNEFKNKDISNFQTFKSRKAFAKNALEVYSRERILVVTMDKKLNKIDSHLLHEGGTSFASLSPQEILEIIITDKPYCIFIAHNHPNGFCDESPEDINFTQELYKWLSLYSIELVDHIIVGREGAKSLRESSNVIMKWIS